MTLLHYVGKRRTTHGFKFWCRGRLYKKTGFPTSTLAKSAEATLRRELDEQAYEAEWGPLPGARRATPWAVAIERYEAAKVQKRSLAADRPRLRWWGEFLAAQSVAALQAVTPALVDKGKQALFAEGKTAGTVRNYLGTLRALCRLWVREHQLRADPVAEVELPEAADREPRVPTPAERRQLIQAAAREALSVRVMIAAALYTGLREASLAGLTAEDLRERPGFVRACVKGGKTAWLPVAPTLFRAFRSLGVKSGPLFRGSRGRPFGRRIPERAWNRIRARAGLPWLRFHDLRHTFGTELSDLGVPPRVIQRLLVHSSLEMTEKYLRGRDARLVEATRRLDRLYQGEGWDSDPVDQNSDLRGRPHRRLRRQR